MKLTGAVSVRPTYPDGIATFGLTCRPSLGGMRL
jgi:hypothetical protein